MTKHEKIETDAAKPVNGLSLLRQPFPSNQVSKLPKETRAQIDARKNREHGCMVFNCTVCGGHHHKDAVHLDYVGHAALTDRLLDTDMEWSWEPVGFTPEGLPALDRNGGLWIRLTVCGVTRYGYGAADGKSGGDAMKEMIGDALRNAAMRFGAALDLWHKGDLHAEDEGDSTGNGASDETDKITDSDRDLIQTLAGVTGKTTQQICGAYKVDNLKQLSAKQGAAVIAKLQSIAKEPANA